MKTSNNLLALTFSKGQAEAEQYFRLMILDDQPGPIFSAFQSINLFLFTLINLFSFFVFVHFSTHYSFFN